MRLSFPDNLEFYGKIRGCVRTQKARGDRPQDIHHLQGGMLVCWHVRAQGYNSSWACFPIPQVEGETGWEFTKPLNLLLCFPQNSCCANRLDSS